MLMTRPAHGRYRKRFWHKGADIAKETINPPQLQTNNFGIFSESVDGAGNGIPSSY
jgi:hypothetical protein